MCPLIRPAGDSWIAEERWQSGRMRIIANDVTPEMGSEGSNPSLSVPKPAEFCGLFRLPSEAGKPRRCLPPTSPGSWGRESDSQGRQRRTLGSEGSDRKMMERSEREPGHRPKVGRGRLLRRACKMTRCLIHEMRQQVPGFRSREQLMARRSRSRHLDNATTCVLLKPLAGIQHRGVSLHRTPADVGQ